MLRNISNNLKIKSLIFFFPFSFLCFSVHSIALNYDDCISFSKNEYEKIYCLIKSKGKGARLPSFQDFKNSNTTTQWLLLKRDANELNIELAKPKMVKNNKNARQFTGPKESISNKEKNKETSISNENSLQNCVLEKTKIQCKHNLFELVRNISRPSSLNKEKLTLFKDNNLSQNQQEFMRFAYSSYINNMLSLGLGDSTMSYTKFNTIFLENKQNQNRFSQRFNKMFNLLIEERKQMSTLASYDNSTPNSIKACWQLEHSIILCDNIKRNWIYKLIKN